MPITKFPSGLQVETFEPPPRGLDPLKASNAELVKHGIPRRPTEDQRTMKEYEAVLRRLQRRFFYIEPTFTRREDKQHRPRMRIAEATEASTNWSGAVQYASSGNAFKWVRALGLCQTSMRQYKTPWVGPTAQAGSESMGTAPMTSVRRASNTRSLGRRACPYAFVIPGLSGFLTTRSKSRIFQSTQATRSHA
jgi:hypothetical protein